MEIEEGMPDGGEIEQQIDAFCRRIASAWKKVPHLRFGQMMYDFFYSEYNSYPFYANDNELINKLEKYITSCTSKSYEPKVAVDDNRCVVCGEIIPEGKMVCMACEMKM